MTLFRELNNFIELGYNFFLIDGRVYVDNKEEQFYEFINLKDINYQLKTGDILSYEDINYCEEVILLPFLDLIMYYLLERNADECR